LLDDRGHGSLNKIGANIVKRARSYRRKCSESSDPLTAWLDQRGVEVVRAYDYAIQDLLLDGEPRRRLYASSLANISSLAAVFYVALFRTLRGFLGSFLTSNPTWIKRATEDAQRIALDSNLWAAAFTNHVAILDTQLANSIDRRGNQPVCRIEVASSESLPLQDQTAAAVVTSPPYCTRIDYVVATRPELAILGCTQEEEDELRDRMAGTPTMSTASIAINPSWGATCIALIDAVNAHNSRASSTYYSQYYLQYFRSIFTSLEELNRVLVANGTAVFVVQDSFYKEIRIDLATIFTEMGSSLNWDVTAQLNYPVASNLAEINPRSRKYRQSSKATESVVVLQKIA